MIEYIAAAVGTGVLLYFYYRNHKLNRLEQTAELKKTEFHTVSGFDYLATKEQNDHQRILLSRYAAASQIQDDVEAAVQSGEKLTLHLSVNSHCGEMHSLSTMVYPERMQEFVRILLEDCAAECVDYCNTPLPENCE